MLYRQVELEKCSTKQVAWIPAMLAVRGKFLRIGEDNGWRVNRVYRAMDGEYVLERERDYRYQRDASDI